MSSLLHSLTPLLAQAPLENKDVEAIRAAASRAGGPRLFGADLPIILGVILGLSALLFFWAFFIRKRPKQARGSLVVSRREKASDDAAGTDARRKRRKRRPDHPDNWGRNPTLGETGGLPPARTEENQGPPPEPESPATR